MSTDTQHPTDDLTVMAFREGKASETDALTDGQAPPKIEQLEERMVFFGPRRHG